MARINKEELGKLSLSERIKRLKEIEEESKKDIEEAKKLMKQTETEMRTSEIAEDVGPEPETVEISSLFETEENLEGAVSERAPREGEEEGAVEYTVKHEEGTAEYASEHEHETPGQGVVKIEEQSTYKTTSKDTTERSTASRGVLEEIKKYSKG